jgi:8-oxo-dGTP diphosphatase
MDRYVVGFAFGPHMNSVLLIEKTHPEWQKGKWNGIGGHIEDGETPIVAMVREAHEETGIDRGFGWQHYATMRGEDFEVFVFKGTAFDAPTCPSDSGEFVAWKSLPLQCPRIANLDFLIEAAKVCHSFNHLEITYGKNGDTSQIKE